MTLPIAQTKGERPSRSAFADRLTLAIESDALTPNPEPVPIPRAYLRDFEQELLLKYALRRGMPAASLDDMTIRMTPVYQEPVAGQNAPAACRGLQVEVVDPRGATFRQDYNANLFSDVASRQVQEWIADGRLKLDDTYRFELVIGEARAVESTELATGISFGGGPKSEMPPFLVRELEPLKANAEFVGEPMGEHFPVFYLKEAYERAERFARRGAASQPPCETGAALIGSACSCPESGEFFVVIADALEATDADEAKLSLSYTGRTWLRLQAVLKSIQAQPETSTYRLLGQAHGHNFVPLDGAPPCEMCATAKVCSRTSVFVSGDDRTWTQAVFSGAPYALCHIFGLNARQDQVHGLYSLLDNRLTQRGFYVIPDRDWLNEAQ